MIHLLKLLGLDLQRLCLLLPLSRQTLITLGQFATEEKDLALLERFVNIEVHTAQNDIKLTCFWFFSSESFFVSFFAFSNSCSSLETSDEEGEGFDEETLPSNDSGDGKLEVNIRNSLKNKTEQTFSPKVLSDFYVPIFLNKVRKC